MNGVQIRWGTVKELLAFSAWTKKRTSHIHELKALITAPRDAATLVSDRYEATHDASKALEEFIDCMWPEVASLKAAQLEHQRSVLEGFRDTPFTLGVHEDPEGKITVDLPSLG